MSVPYEGRLATLHTPVRRAWEMECEQLCSDARILTRSIAQFVTAERKTGGARGVDDKRPGAMCPANSRPIEVASVGMCML